jgi:hypothetical protein
MKWPGVICRPSKDCPNGSEAGAKQTRAPVTA